MVIILRTIMNNKQNKNKLFIQSHFSHSYISKPILHLRCEQHNVHFVHHLKHRIVALDVLKDISKLIKSVLNVIFLSNNNLGNYQYNAKLKFKANEIG